MSSKDDKAASLDPYVLEGLFPDAVSALTWRSEPLKEVKDHCVVVLDTNTLIVPYTVSPKNLDQIGDTYQKLLDEERLVVPGRVAREFARLRADKLADLHQKLSDQKSKAIQLQAGKYPLLESVTEYQSVLDIEQRVNDLLKEYKVAIGKAMEVVLGLGQGDPVSALYARLFNEGAVLDPEIDREEVSRDLVRRQAHKIPPGYKDASKDDGGIGDLLIWYTILKVGEEREKNVLFVTGDLKADWWHRGSGGVPLYPRHELVEEFRRQSGGLSFHIATFSAFLKLYGADESVVREARRGEIAQQESADSARKRVPVGYAQLVVVEEWWEHPVSQAQVLLVAENGTYQDGATNEEGVVTIPRPQQGRLTVLCAHEEFQGYVGKEIDLSQETVIRIRRGNGVGSIIFQDRTGHVPGLAGRLNPIHDHLGRYYVYAKNIAINDGLRQPVPFELEEPLTMQDAHGNAYLISVVEMVGDVSLIEYSLL